jgi:hypothetical protein
VRRLRGPLRAGEDARGGRGRARSSGASPPSTPLVRRAAARASGCAATPSRGRRDQVVLAMTSGRRERRGRGSAEVIRSSIEDSLEQRRPAVVGLSYLRRPDPSATPPSRLWRSTSSSEPARHGLSVARTARRCSLGRRTARLLGRLRWVRGRIDERLELGELLPGEEARARRALLRLEARRDGRSSRTGWPAFRRSRGTARRAGGDVGDRPVFCLRDSRRAPA